MDGKESRRSRPKRSGLAASCVVKRAARPARSPSKPMMIVVRRPPKGMMVARSGPNEDSRKPAKRCCQLSTLYPFRQQPSGVATRTPPEFDRAGRRPRFSLQPRLGEGRWFFGHGGDSWELEGTPPCLFLSIALLWRPRLYVPFIRPSGQCTARPASCRSALPARTLEYAAAGLLAGRGAGRPEHHGDGRLGAAALGRKLAGDARWRPCIGRSPTASRSRCSRDSDQAVHGRRRRSARRVCSDATAWELLGLGTELSTTWTTTPATSPSRSKGIWGEAAGHGRRSGQLAAGEFRVRADYFQNWRQRVEVYYVDPNDHTVQQRIADGLSGHRGACRAGRGGRGGASPGQPQASRSLHSAGRLSGESARCEERIHAAAKP